MWQCDDHGHWRMCSSFSSSSSCRTFLVVAVTTMTMLVVVAAAVAAPWWDQWQSMMMMTIVIPAHVVASYCYYHQWLMLMLTSMCLLVKYCVLQSMEQHSHRFHAEDWSIFRSTCSFDHWLNDTVTSLRCWCCSDLRLFIFVFLVNDNFSLKLYWTSYNNLHFTE